MLSSKIECNYATEKKDNAIRGHQQEIKMADAILF